jgi:hypothetical protein
VELLRLLLCVELLLVSALVLPLLWVLLLLHCVRCIGIRLLEVGSVGAACRAHRVGELVGLGDMLLLVNLCMVVGGV